MLVQDLISVNEHTPQNFSVSLVLQSNSLVLAANNNCFEKKKFHSRSLNKKPSIYAVVITTEKL